MLLAYRCLNSTFINSFGVMHMPLKMNDPAFLNLIHLFIYFFYFFYFFPASENSQVANARFQAAAAIRDAAMREWSFLTADEKKSLIG